MHMPAIEMPPEDVAVTTTRRIDTGLALTGGGDLSADRTLAVVPAALAQLVQVAVDGVTITGNGTAGSPLVSVGGGGGVSLPYVDLRQAPYSVVANDASKATQNRLGVAAAITAFLGTGAHLHLPSGTIYFDWNSATTDFSSIAFQGLTCHDFELSGEGMFATTIVMQGNALGADRFGIVVNKGAARIHLHDFGIRAGTITNPDPTDQSHLIQIGRDTATGTNDVYLNRLYFGQSIGDQFRIVGNAAALVTRVRMTNVVMDGSGIGSGARSCIGIQRGVQELEIGNFYCRGAKNSEIDFEPTASVAITDVNIHDGVVDHRISRSDVAVSFGGNSGAILTRGGLHNVTVLEGQAQIFDCDQVSVSNLNVNIDGTAGGPMDSSIIPALYIYGLVTGAVVTNPNIFRNPGGTLGASQCITAIHHAGHGNPDRIEISGGILSNCSGSCIDIESTTKVDILGTRLRYTGADAGTYDAIVIRSTGADCSSAAVRNVAIGPPTPQKWNSAIAIVTSDTFQIKKWSVMGVSAPGACSAGVRISESGGGTGDRYPMIVDNDFDGVSNEWTTPAPSGTAVIVQGNRGSRCVFVGEASPEGSVAAPQGSTYVLKNGDSTVEYRKDTGTGNTGWRLTRGTTISPTAIGAGPTADYFPTGIDTAELVRQDTTAAAVVSGLKMNSLPSARRVTLVNVSANNLTLNHADGASTAAYQFSLPGAANKVLTPGTATQLVYDATSSRWRALS